MKKDIIKIDKKKFLKKLHYPGWAEDSKLLDLHKKVEQLLDQATVEPTEEEPLQDKPLEEECPNETGQHCPKCHTRLTI